MLVAVVVTRRLGCAAVLCLRAHAQAQAEAQAGKQAAHLEAPQQEGAQHSVQPLNQLLQSASESSHSQEERGRQQVSGAWGAGAAGLCLVFNLPPIPSCTLLRHALHLFLRQSLAPAPHPSHTRATPTTRHAVPQRTLLYASEPSTMPVRGLQNQSLNCAWLAKMPGMRKCMRLHSSIRSFWRGVPAARSSSNTPGREGGRGGDGPRVKQSAVAAGRAKIQQKGGGKVGSCYLTMCKLHVTQRHPSGCASPSPPPPGRRPPSSPLPQPRQAHSDPCLPRPTVPPLPPPLHTHTPGSPPPRKAHR